jgi:hypothetical protein
MLFVILCNINMSEKIYSFGFDYNGLRTYVVVFGGLMIIVFFIGSY